MVERKLRSKLLTKYHRKHSKTISLCLLLILSLALTLTHINSPQHKKILKVDVPLAVRVLGVWGEAEDRGSPQAQSIEFPEHEVFQETEGVAGAVEAQNDKGGLHVDS